MVGHHGSSTDETSDVGASREKPLTVQLATVDPFSVSVKRDGDMGIGIRQILVNDTDELLLLSNRFFKKLWDKSPEGLLPQFAESRVRWAEAAVEIQNHRRVAILRVVYSYMYFDAHGWLDTDGMQDAALKIEAGIGNIFLTRSDKVINASSRFAARRRDHEAVWRPSPKVEKAIYDNVIFGSLPKAAIRHFAAGLRIGELSLPDDFHGLLPWGHIDNRPFLRCLHGYGLCLWRLGRIHEAEQVFERILWLNPADNQGARFVIEDVRAKMTWEESTRAAT